MEYSHVIRKNIGRRLHIIFSPRNSIFDNLYTQLVSNIKYSP